ncbi:MAG: DUF2480 family protein [Chitinophagaceae bacterium]|nr:MAG: DUF2480 family protein [Chitinophagaceae bacterium]
MTETIVNKVAESGLITLDPAHFFPHEELMVFDMKDHLFMGLILKEKDFRAALKTLDWEQYRDANVAVTCSADAIIPVWAYMLVASNLQPVAREIVMGTKEDLHRHLFLNNISRINLAEFQDKRVVVKGCGDTPIGDFVYLELTRVLRPVAKSIMYGEACSTVPVFKKKE